MFLLCGLLVYIVTIHGSDLPCEERLDVISTSAWPMLPTDCFGQHIIDEAELINVETGGGGSHALIHTKERETYIYGNSKYFHIYGNDTARELVEIRGLRVVDAKFGPIEDLLVILTAEGSVWTMGRNSHGQLAHHGIVDQNVLSRVEGLPPVRQIAVGRLHCVVLTRGGQLFSWGNNAQHQLGYSTRDNINPTPRSIALRQEMTFPKSVCCGYSYCAAFTETLKVFTWGESGRIGRPLRGSIPEEVVGLPRDENITKVTCGRHHTLALMANGTLFGWGENSRGELLQITGGAPRATALELEGRMVRDVVPGTWLTIIRTFSLSVEYFGTYSGTNYNTPQTAHNMVHGRDVMAKSHYGQETSGSVRLGCRSNRRQFCQDVDNPGN